MSQTSAQLLADSLGTASTGTVPIGGIILWSSSVETIPTGYALCDGGNGTPDLRDRFVVGASSGTSVNWPGVRVALTGGSRDAVVVSHNHGVNDPKHSHSFRAAIDIGGSTDDGGPPDERSETKNLSTENKATGVTIKTEGVSGTNKNLPPYYALAYIMRIA